MKILFYPALPRPWDYSIISMIHYLGYSIAKSVEHPFDFGIMWDDETFIKPTKELLDIAKSKLILNINCHDISKVRVDQLMKEICGYGSLIDPKTFTGKCIKKYDENGKGGGEIIDCPIAELIPEDGSIYQQFIETNPAGPQLEYRVPIVMGTIPILFEVYKDNPEEVQGKLISNQHKHSITPKEVGEIFSTKEQEQILLFCNKLGFDIGELDILRCTDTGRMHIIDANKTPTYFSWINAYWKPADKRRAVASVSEAWEQQLLAKIPEAQTA